MSLALGGRTPAVQLSTYSILVDSTRRLSMSRSSGVMASSPLSPAAAEAAAARDRMKPSRWAHFWTASRKPGWVRAVSKWADVV